MLNAIEIADILLTNRVTTYTKQKHYHHFLYFLPKSGKTYILLKLENQSILPIYPR
jgi:hypothetical protein